MCQVICYTTRLLQTLFFPSFEAGLRFGVCVSVRGGAPGSDHTAKKAESWSKFWCCLKGFGSPLPQSRQAVPAVVIVPPGPKLTGPVQGFLCPFVLLLVSVQ